VKMTSQTPFLAAGLPGLTFGMSLGRGLSIQLDPQEEVVIPELEVQTEVDECFIQNSNVPHAMLVIHIHALHDLVVNSFDSSSEVIVYASLDVGSVRKATAQKTYHTKNNSTVIFNEVKYFPVVVNPSPKADMNKITILVFACKLGEESAVTVSKHKMIGKYETNIQKLLKVMVCKEEGSLLNKKGNIAGKIELEYGIMYGSFGYGQSHQLKSTTHSAKEITKMCLFPRLPPVDQTEFRGTAIFPRKLKNPSFIKLEDEAVDLEPDISSTKGEPSLHCPDFPLLKQNMQRLGQLREVMHKQSTRTKRIYFLDKLLQDNSGVATEEDDNSDDETNKHDGRSVIPPALALLMNATKFFSDAPGINKRRKPSKDSQSDDESRSRSQSVQPGNSKDFERIRDRIFAQRRKSLAPSPLQ